jgi:lysyl-tRNA synthetase class 1
MSDATPEVLSLPVRLLAILREYDARTDDFNEASLSFVLERQQQDCDTVSELERTAIFAEIAALQLYLFPGQQKSRWGTRYSFALEGTRQDGTPCGNVDHAIIQYWIERAGTAKHPVLKGRYADVVWDLSKLVGAKPSIQMLQQAVDSYVECGQRFPSGEDTEDRLERALELALSVVDKQRVGVVVDTLLGLPGSTDRAEPYGIWLFDVLYERKGVDLTADQQKQLIDRLEKELQQICESSNPFGIPARPRALRLASSTASFWYWGFPGFES